MPCTPSPYLYGWLVGTQLCLKPLVFLPQVLHTCQVTAIVFRAYQ